MPEPAFPHFSLVALQAGAVFLYGGYYKTKVVSQLFDSHKDRTEVEELSETGVEVGRMRLEPAQRGSNKTARQRLFVRPLADVDERLSRSIASSGTLTQRL